MSFYLPNPEVRPTGAEVVEYVDTIPPEFEAVTDPPPLRPADGSKDHEGDDEAEPEPGPCSGPSP
jgi:hypothetical protein